MGSLEYSHRWYEAVLLINQRLIRSWTEQTLLKNYLYQNRNSTHQSQFFKENKGCRVCSVGKQATTCCTTRGPAVCFLLLRANKGKIYFSLTFFLNLN